MNVYHVPCLYKCFYYISCANISPHFDNLYIYRMSTFKTLLHAKSHDILVVLWMQFGHIIWVPRDFLLIYHYKRIITLFIGIDKAFPHIYVRDTYKSSKNTIFVPSVLLKSTKKKHIHQTYLHNLCISEQ